LADKRRVEQEQIESQNLQASHIEEARIYVIAVEEKARAIAQENE
jgi:hypothetical protein